MKISTAVIVLLLIVNYNCKNTFPEDKPTIVGGGKTEYKIVDDIRPPEGYKLVSTGSGSFGDWLRKISLKNDRIVYLYNGLQKQNQAAQFAVLDIPVGKKDLQQCADAVIRLRAEYFFNKKRYEEIEFRDNNDTSYRWEGGGDRKLFDKYLEKVFGWCGSASLEKQLKPVDDLLNIQTGDVFIKGGFPGHAMIVIAVAINNTGQKVFMLAQSYMPAQDIHIVNNPVDKKLSPWYDMNNTSILITPEWTFSKNQLRRW